MGPARPGGGALTVGAPPRCLRIMVDVTGLGAELRFARNAAHATRRLR